MRLRRDDPHTLAGAYALDALTGAEKARFERHLAGCPACRLEATGLAETTARLAAAAAVEPPPQLREQVLAQATRTRQLPPAAPVGRRAGGWRRAPRLAVAAAGCFLLAALALGGLLMSSQHRLGQEQARSRAITAVLNAPDATMTTARARMGGTATVVMSHTDHALVLTTARLPAPPPAMRYQVWLMGPEGPRPAGMLPPAHQGMTAPVIVTGVAAGDMVGVTMEPASGSPRPTSPPVIMLVLRS